MYVFIYLFFAWLEVKEGILQKYHNSIFTLVYKESAKQ